MPLGTSWRYWNGSVWADVDGLTETVAGISDFTTTGVGLVYWVEASDWAQTAVNGSTLYWIRIDSANFGTGTDSPATLSYIIRANAPSCLCYTVATSTGVGGSFSYTPCTASGDSGTYNYSANETFQVCAESAPSGGINIVVQPCTTITECTSNAGTPKGGCTGCTP